MATTTRTRKAQEIWETTTGGTTWLHVKDPRNPDGWVLKKVGGKGTKRITLSVEEREFNQELVTYENSHLDPFTNGLLIRVHPKEAARGENELTDDDLIAMLRGDDATFEKALHIKAEVVLRRLLALAEANTTMLRYQALQAVIEDRFKIGKTSKVVQEMMDDDRKYADADL